MITFIYFIYPWFLADADKVNRRINGALKRHYIHIKVNRISQLREFAGNFRWQKNHK